MNSKEKYEHAIRENENEVLRRKIRAGPSNELAGDTLRVLIHLFKTDEREDRDVGAMTTKLAMERSILQYHLEQLQNASMVESETERHLLSRIYWALTPEGRKRVVEGKLI
jgi:DNA-binding MarR family transcriptional regulator